MNHNQSTNHHQELFFYHIYPLGFCGEQGLDAVSHAIPEMQRLGINAVYFGPVFASSNHGYDTIDYFRIDSRLGSNAEFAGLVGQLHDSGIRVVLDGVFNHVGRDFWAFQRLLEEGESSEYRHWFHGVDFSQQSPLGDPFAYEGWEGHFELVTLNLDHGPVRDHLFAAIDWMIRDLAIDGLRLDVAYSLPKWFLQDLRAHVRQHRDDFYLLGEVIHGNYTEYLGPDTLDAVTNYECYKGLWSSHNDANYFEIAHSLQRQFGDGADRGISGGYPLYNFADNHDVDRLGSVLSEPAHLFPLHGILMTMPGTPSLYYGSEFGIQGQKVDGDDRPLRPTWAAVHAAAAANAPTAAPGALPQLRDPAIARELPRFIARLAEIRQTSPALLYGSYQQLTVAHTQLAFLRNCDEQQAVTAVNAAGEPARITIELPGARQLRSLFDSSVIEVQDGRCEIQLPGFGTAVYEVHT